MKHFIIGFLILCTCFSNIHAQRREPSTVELGLMGGLSIYSGDLSPQELGLYFKGLNPAVGVFGRYNANKALALRLGLSFTKLDGDDAVTGIPERSLNFRTKLVEVALTGEWNFLMLGDPKKFHLSPYLFAGVGIYHFNPEGRYDGGWIELQPLGTEGQGLPGYEAPYKLTQFSVPFGMGIKFFLNRTITLGLEFGPRKLFTDYLDDISHATVNYFDILEGNGTLAAIMSNPTLKEPNPDNVDYFRGGKYLDWYYLGGLTISVKLDNSDRLSGRGIGCPTF